MIKILKIAENLGKIILWHRNGRRSLLNKIWLLKPSVSEWQFQKQDAERVIRRLTGVTGVTNFITVKPRLKPSELKEKIEQALVRSAETDAKRITVEVEGSNVILKGTVRTWAEREEAERAAWLTYWLPRSI